MTMSNSCHRYNARLAKMLKRCCLLLILFALASCQQQVEHGGKTPLVQVGSCVLYKEDMIRSMPYGLSESDSVEFAQKFVHKWIEEQLLYEKAEHNVRGDERIERMVADYRRTLVMNNYERELLQQKMPEEILEEELQKYYTDNKQLFILEEPVMKGVFIKAPLSSPGLKDLKRWYKEKSDESLEQLEMYAFRNAVLYEYFYDYWVPVSELEGKVIMDLSKLDEDFEKYRNMEAEYGGYCYLLHVEEYVMEGKEKPYDLARHEIIDLLANSRKVEFMNRVKNDLYNQSVEMGRIKYYYNNETMQIMGGTERYDDDSNAAAGTR